MGFEQEGEHDSGKGDSMSDDMWRERRDRDDFSEYGSLFDEAEPTQNIQEVASTAGGDDDDPEPESDSGTISFGESDTGSLPHWTEPPTGEVPRLEGAVGEYDETDDSELDVWSSFSSESPVWKDDADDESGAVDQAERATGQHRRVEDATSRVTGQQRRVTGESEVVAREPSRITIGTDPSGIPRRPTPQTGRRRGNVPPPSAARTRSAPPQKSGRDMPAAIAVGLLLAAVFLAAVMYRPWAAAAVVTLILGLAAVEFYDKVAEKGYRPAVFPGIATCVAAPLAAYWLGDGTLPLVLAFGFMATAGSFIGARNVEAGPMPNVSITTLGIMWIGFLGSFAMLILRFSTNSGSSLPLPQNRGTDTLFLVALGVVANDVGALFVGSAAGRTPLRQWISPNKTVEGLIGGTLMTIVAMVVVGIGEWSDTWTSQKHLFYLAIVIAVMAPLGDLVESMFKRNLDIKDFGSIVKGHGGVLDRFDGFLFTLPAVYYLTVVLEPWRAATG
jgi:phosphatidate cytidylyltransferase